MNGPRGSVSRGRLHGARVALALVVLGLAVFAFAGTAQANTIAAKNFRVQPKGTVGTGVPVIVSGSGTFDGYPLDPASCVLTVDGAVVPRSAYVATFASGRNLYLYWVPAPALADGLRTVSVSVADTAGKQSSVSWSFTVAQKPTGTFTAPDAATPNYDGRPGIGLAVSDNTPAGLSLAGQVHAGGVLDAVAATFGAEGLPAGAHAFALPGELAPGAYTLTATLTDAVGLSSALPSRSFTVVAAEPMTVFTADCLACHEAAGHVTTGITCAECHLSVYHNYADCGDCHEPHSGPVTVTGSCRSCHDKASAPKHTKDSVAPAHLSSCDGCHTESLLERHSMAPEGSAYSFQCGTCHESADPAVAAAISSGAAECSACHAGDVGSVHPAFGVVHAYSGLATSCQAANCHSSDIVATHEGLVGEGGRYPQYADACALCHANEDGARVPGGATAACASCHTSADHEALHAVSDDCAGCHGSSLTTLHSSIGCDGCHASATPAVVAAIAAGHTGCSACHSAEPHPNLVTLHASTVTAGSVQVFGYHEGFSPAESWAECTMCHASTNLLDAHGYGCATCHNGSKPADSFVTWNKGCQQGSCHTPYAHPSGDGPHQGYGCDCHDTLSCDDCHDPASSAPVTTSDVKPAYVGSATISMSAANLTWTCYRIDSGPTHGGTAVFVPGPQDGIETHTIEYWSVNDAGLEESHQVATFTISADIAPPETTSDVLGSYVGPATVTFTVTDDNSTPVRDTFWILNGGERNTGSVAVIAQPPSGTQSYTLEYWSVDVAGNEETPHHIAEFTITNDPVPPVGAVAINGGALYTTSNYVNLTLSASDVGGSGVSQMRFSKDNVTWSAWERYATTKYSWQMSPVQGTETAYVQFRDVAGNICAVSDSILYDSIAPTGTFSINNGAAGASSTTVTLTVGMTDAVSGVTSMRFANDPYISNWTTWSAWEPVSASKTWTLASGNGERWVQAQFMDAAGNTVSRSDSIVASIGDTIDPTGSISIADGAGATNTRSVYLYTDASDTGGVGWVYQMQFSVDGINWMPWENYTGSKAWTLDAGDGVKTVYARYSDYAGHVSAIYSDSIVLDQTAPSGSVVIAGGAESTGSSSVMLTISATDAGGSGLTEMQFSNDSITWSAWQAYATSKSWTLVPGNGDKIVYVRFRDGAGNLGGPWQDSITFATSDTTPPNGSVIINGGAMSTAGPGVVLTLVASDVGGSGVAQMQFSNDAATWSEWETYATAKSWALTSGNGGKTVFARFRDGAGNVSSACSDAITLAVSTATLRFEWPAGSGWADLSVRNASGTVIASTQVSGEDTDLTWAVTVTAGQSYQLLVGQLEDYSTDDAFMNYASIWSYDTRINTDAILSPEETIVWVYR